MQKQKVSQSTIKMDKGYYNNETILENLEKLLSQSTIKMDKGYYIKVDVDYTYCEMSQSTIKMDKGYYLTNIRKQTV